MLCHKEDGRWRPQGVGACEVLAGGGPEALSEAGRCCDVAIPWLGRQSES